MDYIFEDDGFEVGAEIDAYCTRCKTDTPHTVVTKYEDEIRSVLCTTCNTTHAYRPPRGESEEEIPEPIAVRRRQTAQKLTWKDAVAHLDPDTAHAYSPRDSYRVGDALDHPKFGLGYVSEVISDTKLEALFRDEARILVHNRVDLPAPPSSRKSKAKPEARPVEVKGQRPKVEDRRSEPEPEKPAAKGGQKSSVRVETPTASTAKATLPVKPRTPKAKVPAVKPAVPAKATRVARAKPVAARKPDAKPAARAALSTREAKVKRQAPKRKLSKAPQRKAAGR
jgi:hypothetical protein